MITVDEMGPQGVKSYAGRKLLKPHAPEVERARMQADYGRRDVAGYAFGALQPATGEVFTRTYERRTSVNFAAFLEQLEAWVPTEVRRVFVILDNLAAHRSYDVLLFSLAHPRFEFVFQPKRAGYLNLIEPWWKTLKSLALAGRRFESWAEIEVAVERATAYWNAHRRPYVWGRRRRHRVPQRFGVASAPRVCLI